MSTRQTQDIIKAMKLLKELEEAGMKVSLIIMPVTIGGDSYVTAQVNDGTIQKGQDLLEALEMVHAKEFHNAQLNVDSAKSRLDAAENCLAVFSTPTDSASRAVAPVRLVEKKGE